MAKIMIQRFFVAATFALAAVDAQAQIPAPLCPGPVAKIISPASGSTLPEGAVTFTWCNASGDYFLTIESIPGAHNIFYGFPVGVDSVTLGPACNIPSAINPTTGCIPTNGATIFLKLWTNTTQKGRKNYVAAPTVTYTASNSQDYQILYDGWQGVKNALSSGGSYRVSGAKNETVSWAFSGTSFKWVTRRGPDMGIAHVTIDGVRKPDVDLYNPSPIYQATKIYSGLRASSHTVVIQVSGQKNLHATNTKVAFDAVTVGATTTQDTSYLVKYDNWVGRSAVTATQGNYRLNNSAGAFAQLPFTGTQIDWITATGPNYGKAEVFIDGVSRGIRDLYQTTALEGTCFLYRIKSRSPHDQGEGVGNQERGVGRDCGGGGWLHNPLSLSMDRKAIAADWLGNHPGAA